MRATFKLLTVLAVASLASAGCGDDETTPGTDTTLDTTDTVDTADGDTIVPETDSTSDVEAETTNPCGTRECGVVGGETCGTCTGEETCSAAGRCITPGAPLGAFCGVTTTCTSTTPGYPNCLHEQCASNSCLPANQVALAFRDVCTQGCTIYKDTAPANGVNDADALFEDCAPDNVVNGPAGDVFRCVNFAQVGQNPVGVCLPGSEFADCTRDSDCPENEGCEITNIGGAIGSRCMAKYRETSEWTGSVNSLSESCNENVNNGAVEYCDSGLCFGVGCVSLCASNADCDTTRVRPGTGCGNDGKCLTNPSKTCTTDVDCSAFECSPDFEIFGAEYPQFAFDICFPNNCETDADCGGGFYCRFFWNGEPGRDAGLDSLCLPQVEDGADLGEACIDPSETIPGNICKNEDLCIGGFCSTLCRDNGDCNATAGQLCAAAELPGDFDEDGEDDFVLPVQWCETFPGYTTDCLSSSDCAATEVCRVYEVANYEGETLNVDGPYTLAGVCQAFNPDAANPAFPGNAGTFGQACTTGDQCRSGFCYPINEDGTQRICADVCQSTSDCPTNVTIGDQTASGVCVSLLYGWGGDLNDAAKSVYVSLCLPDVSSLVDCSDDYACTGTESCFPNVVAAGPTTAAKIEFLCFETWETEAQRGTKALGDTCNPNAAAEECGSGICVTELANDTQGYCSEICDVGVDGCGNNTTCQDVTRVARVGEYANFAASYGLCLKDQGCSECAGQWDCPGSLACVNLGTAAAADYRCVPGCEENADCTAEGRTTCNTSVDFSGRDAMGCFNKNAGGVPVNFCGN